MVNGTIIWVPPYLLGTTPPLYHSITLAPILFSNTSLNPHPPIQPAFEPMSLRLAEHVRDCVAFGADVGQGLKDEPGLYALNDAVANLFQGRLHDGPLVLLMAREAVVVLFEAVIEGVRERIRKQRARLANAEGDATRELIVGDVVKLYGLKSAAAVGLNGKLATVIKVVADDKYQVRLAENAEGRVVKGVNLNGYPAPMAWDSNALTVQDMTEMGEPLQALYMRCSAAQKKIPEMELSLGSIMHWCVVDKEALEKQQRAAERDVLLRPTKKSAIGLAFKRYDCSDFHDTLNDFARAVASTDPTVIDFLDTFRSVGAKSMLQGAQWLSSPVSETLPDDESLPDLDA